MCRGPALCVPKAFIFIDIRDIFLNLLRCHYCIIILEVTSFWLLSPNYFVEKDQLNYQMMHQHKLSSLATALLFVTVSEGNV